jgi:hypothetical protein
MENLLSDNQGIVPMNDVNHSIVLRLSFFELIYSSSQAFLNLHALGQPQRQLIVGKLESFCFKLVLENKTRSIPQLFLDNIKYLTKELLTKFGI